MNAFIMRKKPVRILKKTNWFISMYNVALNKKYWVENQSNFMLCYKELQDSKKEGHHHYPITTSCWFSEAD